MEVPAFLDVSTSTPAFVDPTYMNTAESHKIRRFLPRSYIMQCARFSVHVISAPCSMVHMRLKKERNILYAALPITTHMFSLLTWIRDPSDCGGILSDTYGGTNQFLKLRVLHLLVTNAH